MSAALQLADHLQNPQIPAKTRTPAALTDKQRAFVAALIASGGNASFAYRQAYPATTNPRIIRAAGSKLKRHPGVVQAVGLALLPAVQVVAPAVESLESRASRIVPTDPLEAAPPMTVDEQAARLWAIGHNVGGGIKIADQMAALAHLAKLKGWNAERAEVSQQLVVFKIER
jgi:hypothetical protein